MIDVVKKSTSKLQPIAQFNIIQPGTYTNNKKRNTATNQCTMHTCSSIEQRCL